MQTFLPYEDFEQSAGVLDYKRLGNQRNEARIIYNSLINNSGWINHPICSMWRGCEDALGLYHDYIVKEWVDRGYNNSDSYILNPYYLTIPKEISGLKMPYWLGLEKFHSSHRAALLFKDYSWYSQFHWKEKPEINYLWIVQ